MPAEIGLAAAHYAEKAVAALRDGDFATAIGALASIDSRAWEALQVRFPGFPSPAEVAALSVEWRGLDRPVPDPAAIAPVGNDVDLVTW
jgi:hypothetical protein